MNINVNKVDSCKIVANVHREEMFGRFSKMVVIHVQRCNVVCAEFGTDWYGFVPPLTAASVGDARGD